MIDLIDCFMRPNREERLAFIHGECGKSEDAKFINISNFHSVIRPTQTGCHSFQVSFNPFVAVNTKAYTRVYGEALVADSSATILSISGRNSIIAIEEFKKAHKEMSDAGLFLVSFTIFPDVFDLSPDLMTFEANCVACYGDSHIETKKYSSVDSNILDACKDDFEKIIAKDVKNNPKKEKNGKPTH